MFQRTGIDDFTFLTRDSFLLVRPGGRFEVYGFTDPTQGHTVPIHRVSYAFPTLSEDYIYWYISMSSNPPPGYTPRCQTGSDTGCRQLYYPTPEDRIHACCVYILNPTNEDNAIVHSFVFFVNLKTLLHPPPEWLNQHCVPRRRKTRVSRREALIHEASRNFGFDSIPTAHPTTVSQGSSYHTTSNTNNTNYPPFPTFDSSPHLSTPSHNQDSYLAAGNPSTSTTTLPTLLTRVPIATSSHRNQSIAVPWKIWGPQSTRWFEECLSTDWQHAVYGSRTAESLRPENHPRVLRSSSTTGSSVPSANSAPPMESHHIDDDDDVNTDDENEDDKETAERQRTSSPRRHLRIRNFNSFVFKDTDLLNEVDSASVLNEDDGGLIYGEAGKRSMPPGKKGKNMTRWAKPRLVTEPSTTPVKGVFTQDIVSWLPYTEVISEETYEVTDVMMDDSRLLLLKVRPNC